jgi:RimJ/RimL family protein N-acetyltransferase
MVGFAPGNARKRSCGVQFVGRRSSAEHRGVGGRAEKRALCALDEAKLVGAAGFYREQEPKSRHNGRIWGVYVTKAFRGRGIGRGLMVRLVEWAKAEPGLRQISLQVGSEQFAARRLYESLGFVVFGRQPRALWVDGRYIDEDYLVLMLDQPAQL